MTAPPAGRIIDPAVAEVGMGWHQQYPEWSRRVYDLARKLARLDGRVPERPARSDTPWFLWREYYRHEAEEVIGPPEPELAQHLERVRQRYGPR